MIANGDLRALLNRPALYGVFRSLVVGRRGRSLLAREHIRARPGDRVWDIGCGPGDVLRDLPPVDYLGCDENPAYIAAARRRFGARGRFLCLRIGRDALPPPSPFDIVLALGVLHHLSDADALSLLVVAKDALKPDGRLVTIDPCFAEGQSRVARYVIRLDRGAHVRTQTQYQALVGRVFPQVRATLRHDILRIPYTHLVLEGRP